MIEGTHHELLRDNGSGRREAGGGHDTVGMAVSLPNQVGSGPCRFGGGICECEQYVLKRRSSTGDL